MYGKSPYDIYKNNAINMASREQLLLMILDASVKYSKMAREAIENRDIEEAHNNLIKTQNIFTELMASLNTDAGEWAEDLFSIYAYINKELREINMKKDLEKMNAIIPLIEQIRELWKDVYKESIKNK